MATNMAAKTDICIFQFIEIAGEHLPYEAVFKPKF